MAWSYVKNLDDSVLPMLPMTAGGAFAKGDPLVISSGKVIKATGGTDTVPVKYVAACAASTDGDSVLCYPALPTAVFRETGNDTYVNGTKMGLTATTLLPDATNTTQTRVQTVGRDERTTTLWHFVSLGWLA